MPSAAGVLGFGGPFDRRTREFLSPWSRMSTKQFKSPGENRHDPIEAQLAQALRTAGGQSETAAPPARSVTECSARELRQMAYDRAEEELGSLQNDLQQLRRRHKDEESDLLRRISAKKRFLRQIAESAESNANPGDD